MLDELFAGYEPFPAHLHRHIVQLYVIKHRRGPETPTEQRRAVYEYLTRTQKDKTGNVRIHTSPALVAWLAGDD